MVSHHLRPSYGFDLFRIPLQESQLGQVSRKGSSGSDLLSIVALRRDIGAMSSVRAGRGSACECSFPPPKVAHLPGIPVPHHWRQDKFCSVIYTFTAPSEIKLGLRLCQKFHPGLVSFLFLFIPQICIMCVFIFIKFKIF